MMNVLKKLRIQLKAKRNRALSTEEIEFLVANGDDFALDRYMMFNSLPGQLHLALLKRDESVVKNYIRYHRLSQEAEMEIFTKPQFKGLLEAYLQNHCPLAAVQEELLKPENQSSLEEFIKFYELDDDLVVDFIKTAPDYLVIEYFKEHEISFEAFSEMLKRSTLLAQAYADEYYLDQESEEKFLLEATPELMSAYVEQSLGYGLHPMGEIVLLNSGNVELIKKYIQHFHLGDEDDNIDYPQEMLLLHMGNKELLLDYVSWHMPCKKFVIELLQSGDKDVAMKLVSSQIIPEEAEKYLLDRGKEFVECYIAHSDFKDVEVEKKLVKTYPAEVLKPYIEKFWLSDLAEAELVRKGDAELIKFYIENNKFCLDAQKLLVKTLNKELIAYYDKLQGFDDEAWKVIGQTFFLNNI